MGKLMIWRKSSRSGANGEQCVEVAVMEDERNA
jgi:hypothetical protein